MTITESSQPVPSPPHVPVRSRQKLRRLRYVDWVSLISATVLILVLALAILGPFLTSVHPNDLSILKAYAPPELGHPLGFDLNGRDLLSRLLHGGRSSVAGAVAVVLSSTVIGVIIAIAAAWRGGLLDTIVVRVIDALFAFPGILFAVLAAALFGVGLSPIVGALCISYIPFVARYVRSAALTQRSLPYISALTIQGVSSFKICVRHILPNVRGVIVAQMVLAFAAAFLDLAALSFIGLGVQAPTPDWGRMISEGLAGVIQGKPQQALYAGTIISLTVLAANLLGDRLAVKKGGAR